MIKGQKKGIKCITSYVSSKERAAYYNELRLTCMKIFQINYFVTTALLLALARRKRI